jgi:hypothetical protein
MTATPVPRFTGLTMTREASESSSSSICRKGKHYRLSYPLIEALPLCHVISVFVDRPLFPFSTALA